MIREVRKHQLRQPVGEKGSNSVQRKATCSVGSCQVVAAVGAHGNRTVEERVYCQCNFS